MSNNKYKNWIELGLKKGFTDIQVHVTDATNLNLKVYEGSVEQNEISKMKTAVLKGIYGGKAVNVRIEDLSDENVNNLLDELIDNAKNITTPEPALIYEGSDHYVKVEEELFDFSKVDPNKKVSLLLEIEKGVKANPLIKSVEGTFYSETETKTVILNSKGLNLSRHATHAMVYVWSAYEKDGQIKTGMGYDMVKNFNDFNPKQVIEDANKEGTSQLGATTIKSGSYPVVFDREQFGAILNIYSDIFSGEAAYRQLTKLIGKENEQIASSIVNLVDSPFHEQALFKVPFDNEGVACEYRHWIKEGKFNGFAHNLKTAAIFNTKPTGNGFGGIDAANLVLEPGEKTLDEVFETIDHGIYITHLSGLHAGVETVSGDFSIQASGFEIVNGKIKRPVEMIVVSGNFFELLMNVEQIANDFKFGMYGVGTSSVKIKNLSIAGE